MSDLSVEIYQITFCQLQFLTSTYIHIRPQLDQKTFPLEAQLSNLSPVEGIDLGVTLQRKKPAEFKHSRSEWKNVDH